LTRSNTKDSLSGTSLKWPAISESDPDATNAFESVVFDAVTTLTVNPFRGRMDFWDEYFEEIIQPIS